MNIEKISALFAGWEESMIWSALQGVMGEIAADDPENPKSARILLGDFAFFAGEPDRGLARSAMDGREFLLAVPKNEGWAACVEAAFPQARRIARYAIKKEPDCFDRERLREFARGVPAGYAVVPIDRALFSQVKREEWSRDFCANFNSWEQYARYGGGFVALYQGEAVAGASSYTAYRDGIEIEVDTREDHRRKGLALCCAAQLILSCLEKGKYPSWDAANRASVALAEKLGYHFDREYPALEVSGQPGSSKEDMICVRRYKNEDWGAVKRIHDRARKIELAYAGLEAAFLPLEIAAEREELFGYPGLFVAEYGGCAAGFAACTEEELAWLYVDPDYARRGIGKSLIRYALRQYPGICSIEVLKGNEPARTIYESMGFTVVELLSGRMPGNEDYSVEVWRMERKTVRGNG